MIPDSVDLQLLFELRSALLDGRLIPLVFMRVLRARGWVIEGDTRLTVEGYTGDERLEMCDCTLVNFRLTRVGYRELLRFAALVVEDPTLREFLDEEECRSLDEEDWDDE